MEFLWTRFYRRSGKVKIEHKVKKIPRQRQSPEWVSCLPLKPKQVCAQWMKTEIWGSPHTSEEKNNPGFASSKEKSVSSNVSWSCFHNGKVLFFLSRIISGCIFTSINTQNQKYKLMFSRRNDSNDWIIKIKKNLVNEWLDVLMLIAFYLSLLGGCKSEQK